MSITTSATQVCRVRFLLLLVMGEHVLTLLSVKTFSRSGSFALLVQQMGFLIRSNNAVIKCIETHHSFVGVLPQTVCINIQHL